MVREIVRFQPHHPASLEIDNDQWIKAGVDPPGSSRPEPSRFCARRANPANGREPSVVISCSAPPATGTRNRRWCVASARCTIRLRPEGSGLFCCEDPPIVSIRAGKALLPQSVARERGAVGRAVRIRRERCRVPFSTCGARIIFTNSHRPRAPILAVADFVATPPQNAAQRGPHYISTRAVR